MAKHVIKLHEIENMIKQRINDITTKCEQDTEATANIMDEVQ